VPTLYNLFGSKDAILVAELEAQAREIARAGSAGPRSAAEGGDSFFQRGMAAFETGMRLVETAPDLYRAVMHMFLTSPESAHMRRRLEEGYIAIMASNLTAAKAAGQLADWAKPDTVARHMFAQYMAAFLAWGVGELDTPMFRLAALSGVCHILAGPARGPFAEEVEAKLYWLASQAPPAKEVHRATSRRR
jgi:AcrR family transcriptional regulator